MEDTQVWRRIGTVVLVLCAVMAALIVISNTIA